MPPSSPVHEGLDVLLVTADRELKDDLMVRLGDHGHVVRRAHNTVAARYETARARPHVVIIDLAFRERSYEPLIHSLRSHQVPLILGLARLANANQKKRALSANLDGILESPISDEVLELRLRAIGTQLRRLDDEFTRAPGLQPDAEPLTPIDALWEWNVIDNTFHAGPSWSRLLGRDHEIPTTDPEHWLQLVHPGDVERVRGVVYDHLLGVTPTFQSTFRIQHGSGGYRWYLGRGQTRRSQITGDNRLVGLLTDISECLRATLPEGDEAGIDPLTSLLAKTKILERIERAMARVRRVGQGSLCVLALDLDRFRRVTDSLGPTTADRLLRAVADRLRPAIRDGDTLGRYSGDEFIIVLDDVGSVQEAIALAKMVEDQLKAPFDVEEMKVVTTTSIGVAMFRADHEYAEEMVRDADTAMHQAKRLGGHRLSVFNPEMRSIEVHRLALETDLYHAIKEHQLRVAYQPIVRLADGHIVGFEALVRWHHPERGLIQPTEFVPLAEETGLIIPIDRWVAETACRQLRSWQIRHRQPSLKVSVNISSTQFLQTDLVAQIDHTLRKTGLYGSSLIVEVTESLIVEHASHASAMVRQLKALDIGISVDDFGTGYSSLSYLKRFDIDTVKIDASFVSSMLVDEDSLEIVRAIAGLARRLGKQTVVEGVEVGTQIELVRAMEADCVQGFYLSPPLEASDLDPVLDAAFSCRPHLDALLALRPQLTNSPEGAAAAPPVAHGHVGL